MTFWNVCIKLLVVSDVNEASWAWSQGRGRRRKSEAEDETKNFFEAKAEATMYEAEARHVRE